MPEREQPHDTGRDSDFAELTAAQLVGLLLQKPGSTLRRLRGANPGAPKTDKPPAAPVVALDSRPRLRALRTFKPKHVQLLLYAAAILFAYLGSVYARGTPEIPRGNYFSMHYAAPYLWAGFLLWLLAEVVANWTRLRDGWRKLDEVGQARWLARILSALVWINALFLLATSLNAPMDQSVGMALDAGLRFVAGALLWLLINLACAVYRRRQGMSPTHPVPAQPSLIIQRKPLRQAVWREISHARKLMALVALAGSLYVWEDAAGNSITLEGIQVWLGQALLWCFVFAPLRWNVLDFASSCIDRWRRVRWRRYRWAMVLFALLMILGYGFRYDMLDEMPRYLYSDMVINILDAWDIHDDDLYLVFLAHNGGREPLFVYLLSVFASQPGMNFDRFALVHYCALWGLLTLPLIFLCALEVFAGFTRDRKWALTAGLCMMGLVAGSFWHVVLARQGMRVNPVTFFTAATMIFYAQALRRNRRVYFVLAGLCLGFGLFTYPSMRMIPPAIVIGVIVTLLLRRHAWRERVKYLLNLAALAGIAIAVFLPLMRYWAQYPQEFTQRSSTRLFGDMPTSEAEREAFLLQSGARYLKNWHKTLLIYHYYGEATWVTAVSHEPAMDPFAAAFMVLGAAAWLALMATTRDPFVWFMPVFLIFALLPTSLALAFPIEVPSFSRANAAITPSYMIAALPLAVFCRHLYRCLPRIPGTLAGLAFGALIILASNQYNAANYFGYFREQYNRSSHAYVQAGAALRGFVDSGGAFGNAFAADTPHWWDHRAVWIEAGVRNLDYQARARDLPRKIRRNYEGHGPYNLMPERDLLFFYANNDSQAPILLQEWFPQGRSQLIETHHPARGFYMYRVPALGHQGIRDFINQYA